MVDRLARELELEQNPDGGWSYRKGGSWTEPTCFALLALASSDGSPAARARGLGWLLRLQRSDGGWSPEPSVSVSTWVTSLALIALASDASATDAIARGVGWLKTQMGRQSVALERLRAWLFGATPSEGNPEGWSWFPGTASWVMPTALAVVALSKSRAYEKDRAIEARLVAARSFLMSRRCADGGWNHGGSLVRSEGAQSYAETTGMVLLAFPSGSSSALPSSLACLERWLTNVDSVESESWARIALSAHGRTPASACKLNRCWTNYERSLYLLAEACRCGRNELAIATS